MRKRATHGSGLLSGGEEAPRQTTSDGGRQGASQGLEPAQLTGPAAEEAVGLALQRQSVAGGGGLRRSSSQSRLAWGALQADEAEELAAGRLTTKQQLLQQASPAPSGLRHSKSFGGHLADLMQASRAAPRGAGPAGWAAPRAGGTLRAAAARAAAV